MTSLSKPEDGAGQGKHHDPNHDTRALDRLPGLQGDDLHGVADTEVSVNRDAGEEEDGAVEVKVEEEANQATHEVPEHPSVLHDVARHQKGQRQPVHEVRGRQVDHVDRRGVPALGAAERLVQDVPLQRDAEEEGERVADGEEDILVGLINAARRRRWGGGGVENVFSGGHGEGGVLLM